MVAGEVGEQALDRGARQAGEDAVGLHGVDDLEPVEAADGRRRGGPPSRSRAGRFAATGRRPRSASSWAEMKRIFEASWPSCLRVKAKRSPRSGRRKTTASPKSGAVLGGAEGDDVDAGIGGELAQRDAEGGGGVGDAGAVDVEVHPEPVGGVGDRAGLLERVDGAELGRLGDRDDARLDVVLVAALGLPARDVRGRQLAVLGARR